MDFIVVGSSEAAVGSVAEKLDRISGLRIAPATHLYSQFSGDFDEFKKSAYFSTYLEHYPQATNTDSLLELANLVKRGGAELVGEKTPSHLRHVSSFSDSTKVLIIKGGFWSTLKSEFTAPENDAKSLRQIFLKHCVDSYTEFQVRREYVDRVKTVRVPSDGCLSDTQCNDICQWLGVDSTHHFQADTAQSDAIVPMKSPSAKQGRRAIVVGAWPRYGETNPRNTHMYNDVNELDCGVRIIDVKAQPGKLIFCDFVHLHWPEYAFKGKFSAISSLIFVAVFFTLKLFSVKVLQTVHNDWKTEIKGNFLSMVYKFYLTRIVHCFLVPSAASISAIPKGSRFKLLPLGLYPKISASEMPEVSFNDYFLIVGRITRKKKLHSFVDRADIPEGGLLLIAGKGEDREIEEITRTEVMARHQNSEFEFEFLSENRIHSLVSQAKGVIVFYDAGLNSGILTLCATYNVPVVTNLDWLEKDMRRLYSQHFSHSAKDLASYSSSGLTIAVVAERFCKIISLLAERN